MKVNYFINYIWTFGTDDSVIHRERNIIKVDDEKDIQQQVDKHFSHYAKGISSASNLRGQIESIIKI